MRVETCIKLLMKSKGVTQVTMARMLGLKSQQTVQDRLNGKSKNMTINNVLDMLDVMGYELVLRESHSGRRREDEIIITREDEIEL